MQYRRIVVVVGALSLCTSLLIAVPFVHEWSFAPPSSHTALVAKLHAAQVTTVPKPLVINGTQVCGAHGDSKDSKTKTLDDQKNRIDSVADNQYVPVAWEDMVKTLTAADVAKVQGAPISVVGFLSKQINVEDSGSGESTNCHLTQADEVDWHIYLTSHSSQEMADAIIVETTPRTRPLHDWNLPDFEKLVDTDTQVRVSGWLMYDWQHVSVIGKERATVWEIHPITKIEEKTSNGWVSIKGQ